MISANWDINESSVFDIKIEIYTQGVETYFVTGSTLTKSNITNPDNVEGNNPYTVNAGGSVASGVFTAGNSNRKLVLGNDDVIMGSVQWSEDISDPSGFRIGCANTSEFSFLLNNHDGRFDGYDFRNLGLKVFVGYEGSWIQRGVYYVNEQENTGGQIRIVAYDKLSWLDVSFRSFQSPFDSIKNTVYSRPNGISWERGRELWWIVHSLTSCVGIETSAENTEPYSTGTRTTFANSNMKVEVGSDELDDMTLRDLLTYCMQLCGCYAKVDNEGNLVVRCFAAPGYKTSGDPEEYITEYVEAEYNPNTGGFDDVVKEFSYYKPAPLTPVYTPSYELKNITGLPTVGISKIEMGGVVVGYGDKIVKVGDEHEGLVFAITNNPLIVSNGKALEVGENIYNSLSLVDLYTFNCSTFSDPRLEVGDKIYFRVKTAKDESWTTYYSFITSMQLPLGGVATTSCRVDKDAPTSFAEAYNGEQSTEGLVKNVEDKVQEAESRINNFGMLNVLDFGAKGDGTTNDLESFNKAIAACPPHGTVYVPSCCKVKGSDGKYTWQPCTYYVSDTININKPMTLMGDYHGWDVVEYTNDISATAFGRSHIKSNASTYAIKATVMGVALKNLQVTCNKTVAAGIFITNTSARIEPFGHFNIIDNCAVFGDDKYQGDGIRAESFGLSRISNCHTCRFGTGIRITTREVNGNKLINTSLIIDRCWTQNFLLCGIRLEDLYYATLLTCACDSVAGGGDILNEKTGYILSNCISVKMVACGAEMYPIRDGIALYNCQNIEISGLITGGQNNPTDGSKGIIVYTPSTFRITDMQLLRVQYPFYFASNARSGSKFVIENSNINKIQGSNLEAKSIEGNFYDSEAKSSSITIGGGSSSSGDITVEVGDCALAASINKRLTDAPTNLTSMSQGGTDNPSTYIDSMSFKYQKIGKVVVFHVSYKMKQAVSAGITDIILSPAPPNPITNVVAISGNTSLGDGDYTSGVRSFVINQSNSRVNIKGSHKANMTYTASGAYITSDASNLTGGGSDVTVGGGSSDGGGTTTPTTSKVTRFLSAMNTLSDGRYHYYDGSYNSIGCSNFIIEGLQMAGIISAGESFHAGSGYTGVLGDTSKFTRYSFNASILTPGDILFANGHAVVWANANGDVYEAAPESTHSLATCGTGVGLHKGHGTLACGGTWLYIFRIKG